MEDIYCECGQYLTTYFFALGHCHPGQSVEMSGVPCPAKGCEKTYTITKTPDCAVNGARPDETKLSEKNARIVMGALGVCYSEGVASRGDDSELLTWIADHYPGLKEEFSYLFRP